MGTGNKGFSKYILAAVFVAVLIFGFAFIPGGQASAALCKDITSTWKTGDFPCDVVFGDNGGSTLNTCSYRLVGQPLLYTNPPAWTDVTECKGKTSLPFSLSPHPTAGYARDCTYQGAGACWLQLQAADNSDNVIQDVSYSYNIDYTPPAVSVAGAPSNWQQTSASASTSCADPGIAEYPGGSGCDSSTYRLKTYDSSGSCPINYSDYDLLSSQTISSHKWVCATAKDIAENAGFSSSRIEFKVDRNAPRISAFSVSPLDPQSVTSKSPTLSVSWIVEESVPGESHLQKVTIWRAPFDKKLCNTGTEGTCVWDFDPVVGSAGVPAPANSDNWDRKNPPLNSYTFEPTGDGTYWYGIHVVDNALWEKNQGDYNFAPQKVRIKIGNTRPTLDSVLLSPASPFKANMSVTFTGTWTDAEGDSARLFVCKTPDAPSGSHCSNGSQNDWCVSDFSATSPSECPPVQAGAQGTKTYYAFECDDGQDKLCSQSISGQFVVDTTAPTISVFDATPENGSSFANIANPNIAISWTAADNTGGSGIKRYELWRVPDNNGSPGNWGSNPVPGKENISPSATNTTDNPGNGIWWYGLHAVDNAGNIGYEPSPKQARVDTILPGIPNLISPINNITVETTRPTFDWTDVTDANGVTYRLLADRVPGFNSDDLLDAQGLGFSTYTSIIDLYQGSQYWKVLAKDGAGNQGGFSSRGDYQILLNQPPTASVSCTPSNCIGYTGDVLTLNNNSTDPNGPSDIVRSEWDILGWGSSPDATCVSAPILCNYTVQTQSLGSGTFSSQLKVQDAAGALDTEPKSFTIRQDAVANFNCSLDGSVWQDCTQVKPAKGETVFFQDQSTPSEGATSITNRSWTFASGNPASSSSQNPSSSFQSSGAKQVSLTVTDNAGRQDTKQVTINVSLSFPDWQEISPF